MMKVRPFYLANQFVPLVGLLLGNSIAGISIGIRTALMSLTENQLAVEAYLSMGASRWEAGQPIAIRSSPAVLTAQSFPFNAAFPSSRFFSINSSPQTRTAA